MLAAVVFDEVVILMTSPVDVVDGFVVLLATTCTTSPGLIEKHPTVRVTVVPAFAVLGDSE